MFVAENPLGAFDTVSGISTVLRGPLGRLNVVDPSPTPYLVLIFAKS